MKIIMMKIINLKIHMMNMEILNVMKTLYCNLLKKLKICKNIKINNMYLDIIKLLMNKMQKLNKNKMMDFLIMIEENNLKILNMNKQVFIQQMNKFCYRNIKVK